MVSLPFQSRAAQCRWLLLDQGFDFVGGGNQANGRRCCRRHRGRTRVLVVIPSVGPHKVYLRWAPADGRRRCAGGLVVPEPVASDTLATID